MTSINVYMFYLIAIRPFYTVSTDAHSVVLGKLGVLQRMQSVMFDYGVIAPVISSEEVSNPIIFLMEQNNVLLIQLIYMFCILL